MLSQQQTMDNQRPEGAAEQEEESFQGGGQRVTEDCAEGAESEDEGEHEGEHGGVQEEDGE